jgi:hypothetical protein
MTCLKIHKHPSRRFYSAQRALTYAAFFFTGACGSVSNIAIVQSHENLCRVNSRVIVHDKLYWNRYLYLANEVFIKRKNDFPETERSVTEYVAGFEFKFGDQLKNERTSFPEGIVRDDIFLLKNGKIVAQYVDFIASYTVLGTPNSLNCTGLFPKLYSLEGTSDE